MWFPSITHKDTELYREGFHKCQGRLIKLLIPHLFHLLDGISLRILGDVDVGLHGFVVAVTGELHHNVRGDAVGEGKADEGLAAGVGANEFVLGIDFIVAVAVAVASDGVGLVEAANLAEVLQAAVHLLVGDVRQCLSSGEVLVLVFL